MSTRPPMPCPPTTSAPARRCWPGLALVAASCGEQDGPILPEVSWSSEDFDFAADAKTGPMCGGTLEFQQTFVDLLQEIVGQPIDGRKFTYYLLTRSRLVDLLGWSHDGLYNDGRVLVSVAPHHHEVTHAVVDLAIGGSHTFFGEGIAEVFRDRHGENRARVIATIEDGLGYASDLPGELYARAGHFMSYALDVHGNEATVELLTLARREDPPEVLRDAIAAAFDMSYADVLADYAAYPLCKQEQYRWPIAECEVGARVEPVGRVWAIDADLDCTRADVLGRRVTENWTQRTIEVPVAGAYRVIVLDGEVDNALIEIGHCSPGCAPDKGVEIEAGESRTLELRQGRYHITLVALFADSGHLQVRIEPVDIEAWSGAGASLAPHAAPARR